MTERWFRVHADVRTSAKVAALSDYDWRLLSMGLWPLAAANRRDPGVVGRPRRRGLTLGELAADLAPVMGSDETNAGGQMQVVAEPRTSAARLIPALLRLQRAGLVAILRVEADPSCWLSGQDSARAERALRQADLLLEERDFSGGTIRFQLAVVNWRERQYLERRHRHPSDSRDRVRERVRRYRERRRQQPSGSVDPFDQALAEVVDKPVGNPVDKPVKRLVTPPPGNGVTTEKRPSNDPVTTPESHLSRGAEHVTTQILQNTDNRVVPLVTPRFSITATEEPRRRSTGLVPLRDLLPAVGGEERQA